MCLFGPKLREARMRCGLSQRSLAYRVGVSQQTISAIERGARACPPDLLPLLSRTLEDASLVHAYCGTCPARRGA